MRKSIAAVLAGVALLSGCSYRVGDFTIGSTKNYNINSSKFVKGPRVTGEDRHPVIIFPVGIPNMKTAMDNAIEQDKCAVGLSDVVITSLHHSFLFGVIAARVEGNLIIDASQPDCAERAQI